MAKQLNVNLAFSADTSKVKSQLQDLQNQLQKLTMGTNVELGITGDIREASKAAAELSVHLKQATNVQTGTLDFTKLNESIKKSGTSLQDYGKTLASMGPKGQQAFMSLAQAVANSEVPIRRTNAMLKEMGTTLANTARWQLSSSILHGFMGAVQSAYGYAQDLNESLNNIRIVTGQSIDQMSRFADEANKAAKALSTTTTEYTNASLIYYQQGLSDQEVKERADITIKMANVSRQSAEVVSDQMTAVWNNFAKGSEDLEHYANVMTALGAATASSSSEIAEGLNKFAAVADTVGLSYEYAASALATVTATTRQSADVVGTAFKTLFARIQDLELGKTLDDGTTLGSYSQALEKVGIDIKTTNGDMKQMDTILTEMAAKWDTLGKDQQVALAQSVAGVRQYTQLIALMDNWDFMEQNLATAEGSGGALQKQADIYAESWEAAQDRVRAAAEGVYDSLINDEFFIDLLNSIEKIISFVDHLIDNLGGLEGVLAAVGAILTKVFSDQIAQGITNMTYNIKMMTEAGRKAVQEEKAAFVANASQTLANMEGGSSTVQDTASKAYSEQLTLQQKMIDNADKMTEAEQQTVQILMDQLKTRGDAAIAQAKELDAAKKAREEASNNLYVAAAKKAGDSGIKFDTGAVAKELSYVRATVEATKELDAALDGVTSSGQATEQSVTEIYDVFSKLQTKLGSDIITQDQLDSVEQLLIKLQNADAESEDFEATLQSLKGLLGAIGAGVVDGASDKLGADVADVQAYADSVNRTADAQRNLDQANEEVRQSSELVGETIDNAKGKQQTWADVLVSSANFAFTAASALNMLGGAFDKIKDPDATGWEKFLTILTTLGMLIPTLVSLFGTFKKLLSSETVAKIANVAATLAQVAAEKKLNKEKGESSETTKKSIKETWNDTKQKLKNKGKSLKDTWNDAAYKKSGDRFEQVRQIKGKDGTLTNVVKDKTTGKFMTEGAAKKVAGQGAGKALGTAAGGVALIAAGVAVAVGAVKWGIAQFEKQAKAAQEAAEAANKAAEAYKNVAQAYNDFKTGMENYSNAKAGIEELTKGTLEYREAVLQANEAAMELIKNNEGLQYSIDSDGLIQINEESMKVIQEQKLQQMQNAQISSQLASQNARTKQLESDKTDFARKELNSGAGVGAGVGNTLAATGSGAAAGALIGAGIGTIVPVIGNAVGAAAGAIIGGIAGLITGVVGSATAGASSGEEQKALEKLAQVYEKEGNARFADEESFKQMLSEQGITDPLLVKSLTANRESTMQLVAQMAENTAAISSMNEQMIKSEFGEELTSSFVGDNAEELAGQTAEAMGVALESRAAELYESEYKDKAGGLKDKDIQKQYAEAMGWDTSKTENKNGNKATYYDKDGNIVAEDLSDEVARQFLAQQAALQELQGTMPHYVAAVQGLNDLGDKIGEGIGTAIASFAGGDGGNLNTLTQSQFADLSAAEIDPQKDDEGNIISFSLNGEVIDDKKAELLGYESAEAFYEAFTAEVKRVENAWADIKLDFEDAGLDPQVVEKLSLEAAQKFQKSLEKMNYGALGEEGAKAYADGIDMITASVVNMDGELGMGEADMASFIEQLGDVDWSSWYAMDDVNTLIENMGYELDLTTEEMQKFIETMRLVGGASPVEALEQTWSNAELLADSLSKGIPPGSILDEAKYKALIESNAELEGQFMKMLDGTYKYVGSEDLDFSNALNLGEALDQTKEMSELYNNAKKAASDIDFAGLSKMSYVTSKQISDAKSAEKEAEKAEKSAKEQADSFHFLGIGSKKDKAAYDSAASNEDNAEQHRKNLEDQRKRQSEEAKAAVEAVRNNEYLKEVAEYNGWTQEQLDAMITGIQNGEDSAMEQMKVFSSQMNKFMAAGDEGLYDVSAAEEKIASIATSIEELDQLTEQYSLSEATYAKAITGLFASAANEAKSLTELDELKKKVLDAGGEVNNDVYLENVKRLSEEAMNAADSMSALAQAKYEAESRGGEVDPEIYAENIKRVAEETVNAASSFEELSEAWGQALASGAELDTGVYNEKLIELGSSYANCSDEVAAFEKALQSNDAALVEEARSMLEVSVALSELAEKYGLDADATANYADRLSGGTATTAKAKKAFGDMAIAAQRLDRGVKNINENLEDYQKVIKTADRRSFQFSETMDALKTDVADMFNVADGNMFSDMFVEGLLDSQDFADAIDGDVAALDRLRAAATVDIGDNIIADLGEAANEVHYKLDEAGNRIESSAYSAAGAWDYVRGVLADGFTLEEINDEQFVTSLNDMIAASNMTKEQIQSMLGSMGVSAEVVTDYKEMETEVPTYYEHSEEVSSTPFTYTDFDGTVVTSERPVIRKMTIPGPPVKTMGYVPTYSIKTTSGDTSSGGAIDYSNTFSKASPPAVSTSSTSTGGGGGGGGGNKAPNKATKRDKTNKSDVVERYKEVNDAIDNVTDALTRAEKATDRLWGKDKLNAMREENKILQEQYKLVQKKAKQAEQYMKDDAQALKDAGTAVGIEFEFGPEGDIVNYEEAMNQLYKKLETAENTYNQKVAEYNDAIAKAEADGTISDREARELEELEASLSSQEEDVIGGIEDDISNIEEALALYEESKETFEDMGIEMEDIMDQIMQNNYDIIIEGLEIPISLNEEDLRLIDLKLSQLEDDVYRMGEAVALTSTKFAEYQDNLALTDQALEDLRKAHHAGEITDAAYQEGLQEMKEKYYENIEALMELDQSMQDYYGDTLDAANEELSKHTSQIEHQSSVLSHYNSLLGLMGKSNDYEKVGKILEGQAKVAENQAQVSKSWYQARRADADRLKAEYDEALAAGASSAELEILKKKWEDAEVAANEAQEQMLSDAEAWAESLKAVLENKLSQFGKTLEQELTQGFGSFDAMTTSMERAVSLQEEYLTATNQVYETNKLMRTAQMEIDKTSNSAAKKRLKSFIEETDQLQNKTKLSKYELDIQQAKYDLLLAEMALEDAQNAKSTVRLQRDSEGNFGYVYTADQDQMNKAQQELEDAQNKLYNIGLEGANDYTQKYQQTMAEMYDTMTSIQQQYLEGAFASEEEYQNAMSEAQAYYYEKLKGYSSLYQVAVTTDSKVIKDAWSTDYASMTYETERWMQNVSSYVGDVSDAFIDWKDAISDPETGVESIVGSSLDEIGNNVDAVTTKSQALADKITDDVIPALNSEIDQVDTLTGKYAGLRDTIQGAIDKYTELIEQINQETQDTYDGQDDGSGNGGGGSGNGGGGSGSGSGGSGGNGGGSGSDGGNGSGGGDGSTAKPTWDRIVAAYNKINNGAWGNGVQNRINNGAKDGFTEAEVRGGQELINYTYPTTLGGYGYTRDKAKGLMGYDTGGYTGEWGPYGKLALLHEKELVLNENQTKDFLASMEVLDRILEMIDLQAASAQIGGLLSSPGLINYGESETIEQNVHIEASFPAVQDRNEIEEAFNTLINRASQYTNRLQTK